MNPKQTACCFIFVKYIITIFICEIFWIICINFSMTLIVRLYQNDFVVFFGKDGVALCDRCDPSWRSNAKAEDEDGSAEPHVSSCHLISTSFTVWLMDPHKNPCAFTFCRFFEIFEKYGGYKTGKLKLKKPKQLQVTISCFFVFRYWIYCTNLLWCYCMQSVCLCVISHRKFWTLPEHCWQIWDSILTVRLKRRSPNLNNWRQF